MGACQTCLELLGDEDEYTHQQQQHRHGQDRSRQGGGRARSQQTTMKCGKCQYDLVLPPGSQCIKCPRCHTANGVPHQPPGYSQKLGQMQAAAVNQPPPQPTGRKKALLIGCNYPGTRAELRGCINDVHRIQNMLSRSYGFSTSSMRVLTDDSRRPGEMPTRANIIEGMRWLVRGAQPGDVLFFHFSGHGGQEEDPTYTEEDGYDETLCPTDFQLAGQIVDTEVFDILCAPLPAGVKLTAVLDCCHSGTGLDLPFTWTEGRGWREEVNPCLCAADVQLISGCEDYQCSADASDRYGAPAGALTTALCDTLERSPVQPYQQLLHGIHRHLQSHGHSQRPQLTSSQQFQVQGRQFNPCDEIVPNQNPLLGRQFREAKHPHRDFGGGFGDMMDVVQGFGTAMLLGAILPDVLDLSMYGFAADGVMGAMDGMGDGLVGDGGAFDQDGGEDGGGLFGALGGIFGGGEESGGGFLDGFFDE